MKYYIMCEKCIVCLFIIVFEKTVMFYSLLCNADSLKERELKMQTKLTMAAQAESMWICCNLKVWHFLIIISTKLILYSLSLIMNFLIIKIRSNYFCTFDWMGNIF